MSVKRLGLRAKGAEWYVGLFFVTVFLREIKQENAEHVQLVVEGKCSFNMQ